MKLIAIGDIKIELDFYRVTSTGNGEGESQNEATIRLRVGNKEIHAASMGCGPVNALDRAFRKALGRILSEDDRLNQLKLIHYSVVVKNANEGTESLVTVTTVFSFNGNKKMTAEESPDIIDASFQALVEGFEWAFGENTTGDE